LLFEETAGYSIQSLHFTTYIAVHLRFKRRCGKHVNGHRRDMQEKHVSLVDHIYEIPST